MLEKPHLTESSSLETAACSAAFSSAAARSSALRCSRSRCSCSLECAHKIPHQLDGAVAELHGSCKASRDSVGRRM